MKVLKKRLLKTRTKTAFLSQFLMIFGITPLSALSLLALSFQGCSNQASIANRYLTAERLWTDKNYEASVAEFDQILKEDPNSAIALQALLRSSMTKTLFLNLQDQALQGFKLYLERAASSEQVPLVEKQIGEIYFSKLKQYQNAIQHYQRLVEGKKFSSEDQQLFRYRIARSYFLMGKIRASIDQFEALVKQPLTGDLKYRAYLDLGHSWYAFGDAEKNGFQNAISAYTKVEQDLKSPTHPYFQEAEFGIASSMEELDQLEQAYTKFKGLEKTYPSPNVVKIKLIRLEDRLKKKRK